MRGRMAEPNAFANRKPCPELPGRRRPRDVRAWACDMGNTIVTFRAWLFTGLDATARLRSLDIELPLTEIYYKVQFPEPTPLKPVAS